MSKRAPQATSREQRGRHLIDVRINYWPQPGGQVATSRRWLRWICDDMARSLDISRWSGNPPYRRPGSQAGPTKGDVTAKSGVTTKSGVTAKGGVTATDPYCWVETFSYGTCEVNGQEVPCRFEHWVCDDGTFFDRQEVLAAAAKAMKLPPAKVAEVAAGG